VDVKRNWDPGFLWHNVPLGGHFLLYICILCVYSTYIDLDNVCMFHVRSTPRLR